ncbi:MAG: hypothetical protein QM784_07360 [Polyangiaceae bacterium]
MDIREVDANVDRLVLMPTAETHPKGRLYFSAYEVVFWQLGYAFTDHVQATITSWPYVVRDQVFFVDGTVKANFLRTDLLRLAVLGGATYAAEDDGDDATTIRGGVLGQLCVTAGCWTSISGGIIGWKEVGGSEDSLWTGGIGLTSKLSKNIGILLEVDSATGRDNGDPDLADFALLNYGLRFSGRTMGVDIAMVKPMPTHEFVLGLPWISFTYRTDPLSL